MQRNKFYSAAIALVLIAIFSTSWVSPKSTPDKIAATITATFDFRTFPNVTGSFTASWGGVTRTGLSTMQIDLNSNGTRGHCVVTLYPSGGGSITIHQECVFATPIPQGRWEIVSGTGAYTNLQGNGSLTMPPETEAMVGFIY